MSVDELLEALNSIPLRERKRPVYWCGSMIVNPDSNFEIGWIDTSDGILICLNSREEVEE